MLLRAALVSDALVVLDSEGDLAGGVLRLLLEVPHLVHHGAED